ncbi:hypothetical protein [Cellulomonas sp. P24]|uniref:hypothetical protein n=1 Tax=Cellulomonas sp. P24 TaxID=2885206 RepID=UPI00216ABAD0|nr:hypothetical protein [Cellulomonas sp. P24]MCR6493263.1 hypothetical protein [Cellulomonas sp. P24]
MSTDDLAVPGPGDPTPETSAAPPTTSTPADATPGEAPEVAAPPVATPPVTAPPVAAPPRATPVVTPPGATLGAEARAARAAHLAERAHPTPPAPLAPGAVPPPPPDAALDPADAPRHHVVVGVTGAGPAPAAAPAAGPAPATDTPPTLPDAAEPEADVFPAAEPPRRAGIGAHLLGILVGLVAGPVAVLVAGLGESRIVLAYTPPQTAWIDALGTTLVALGALLLIVVVLLGLWTATVPITAGAVVTTAGLTFLIIPERAYTEVLRLFRTDANALTVGQLDLQGVSGVVLLLGVLLLAAGIAIAVARRGGRRYGRLLAAATPPA